MPTFRQQQTSRWVFWQLAISGTAIIIAVALNAQANRSPGRIILKRAEHAT